ncbi:MAG: hypothetical protein WAX89_04290, partial [Alphaproteobacteria bacterium]
MTTNPLLQPLTTPAFDKIEPAHFMPAVEQVIGDIQATLQTLAADTTPPTFASVVEPLERLFRPLSAIQNILYTYYSAASNDDIEQIHQDVSLAASKLQKDVFQNLALADRFAKVVVPEDAEAQHLYNQLKLDFEREGAFLSTEGQQVLKDLDNQLISLCSTFESNLLKGTLQQGVIFEDVAALAGASESYLSAFAKRAAEAGHAKCWLVVPERLLIDELLGCLEVATTRKVLLEALFKVGTV